MRLLLFSSLFVYSSSLYAISCKFLFISSVVAFSTLSTASLAGNATQDLSGINGYYKLISGNSKACKSGETYLEGKGLQSSLFISDGAFIFRNLNAGYLTLPAPTAAPQCRVESMTHTLPGNPLKPAFLMQRQVRSCGSYTVEVESKVSFFNERMVLDIDYDSNNESAYPSKSIHCEFVKRARP